LKYFESILYNTDNTDLATLPKPKLVEQEHENDWALVEAAPLKVINTCTT
jgi:hypothetical protein